MIKLRDKNARIAGFSAFVFVLLCSILISLSITSIGAGNSGSSGDANLTINDTTDNTQIQRYTYCSDFCSLKDNKLPSSWNVYFYANYTNSSGGIINNSNDNGNCTIRFNETGIFTNWISMLFNSSNNRFEHNRSFNYKGNLNYSVNCTSDYGNITLFDTSIITNTDPYIMKTPGGYIDFDLNGDKDILQCTEDNLCVYNFSANVSEDDLNDVLTFNYTQSSNTTLTNFSLNSTAGILSINVTTDMDGSKYIELTVDDNTPGNIKSGILEVNIQAVNDPPQFVNLQNRTLNVTQLFDYIINITDEENNYPYSFNITFLNCSVAQWSTRNCSTSEGRELFNSSQYNSNGTALNISFTPIKNDAGNYTINFTVTDLNNVNNPKNASTSQVVVFEVLNVNSVPYFNYVCGNEMNGSENSLFNCYINASDIDETSNLTITANETWFKFNGTESNSLTLPVNISTGFNASFLVNFTPIDEQVGNWSINFTLTDTTSPIQTNTTNMQIYISNINDSVSLQQIDNVTVYSNFNVTTYINATDDDLLIKDKRVYNENLTFSSNTSWVNITSASVILNTNITGAIIDIYPNSSFSGLNYINISVRDANNHSIDSKVFAINVSVNSPPNWSSSVQREFYLNESINFYLNLSANVSDAQGDAINFSFSIEDQYPFPLFNINKTTGVVNFTPDDLDVGNHSVRINATDSKGSTDYIIFNFTVYNLNDNVSIGRPITATNATVDSNSNINASEDNYTLINIYVYDDDFLINQTSFYDENLSLNVSVQGVNQNLLSNYTLFGTGIPGPNMSQYIIYFAPNHSDIGIYNVSINVTDNSNSSDILVFNLTINAVRHAPNLSSIQNWNISILESFVYDVNVTDVEDVNETASGSNLTYSIANLSANGNFLNISNSGTKGLITNISNLTGKGGIWNYSVTVTDSSSLSASRNFTLRIYDYPVIILPNSSYAFNMVENATSRLNFSVNHSVGDALTYQLYINNVLRNETSANGNGSAFLLNFTANFNDETTCTGAVNLTLNVSNQKLSNSTSWIVNINHTNSPLTFSGTIGPTLSITNSQTYNLNDYFTDIDASDSCNNQTIGFTAQRLSEDTITASIVNWTNSATPSVTFSSSTEQSGNYSIIAFEYNNSLYNSSMLRNSSSNNFTVNITIATTTTPTSGGGGGGSGATPVTTPTPKTIVLKLILPEPVSVDKRDKIVLPIKLINNGQEVLNKISLSSIISLNGNIAQGIHTYFNRNFIDSLKVGQEENVTLTAEVDAETEGMYEITINATVESPKFNDWGKIYLNVKEGASIERKILFVEQLIVDNPECAEIKELVEEARKAYVNKDFKSAEKKIDEAIYACKRSIEQVSALNKVGGIMKGGKILTYVLFTTILAVAIGIFYYLYNRMRLRKVLMGYE